MTDPPVSASSSSQRTVGVIGLGLLGTALAERLLGGAFRVVVYNRTPSKAEPLLAQGAVWSDNPLLECDQVVICLYTTDVVVHVLEEMRAGWRAGLTLIDVTTGDPTQSAALGARLAEHGVDYLESPIAASSEQTRLGEALAMVAGAVEAFERCREVISCIAPKSQFVGPWGCAAKMKLVNNLVLGLNRVALAEGLVFAQMIGLDPSRALEVIRGGNAYSVAMDVKGRKMIERDYSVQAKLSQHMKDVRLMLDEAQAAGRALPASTLHLQLLEQAEQAGFGELDNCAIMEAIERASQAGRTP